MSELLRVNTALEIQELLTDLRLCHQEQEERDRKANS